MALHLDDALAKALGDTRLNARFDRWLRLMQILAFA